MDKTSPSKCTFSDFRLLAWKLTKFLTSFFETTSQFFFKFCFTLQCYDAQFLWNFVTETLYALDKKRPSKYSFSDFWVFSWKFNQFLTPLLKPQDQSFASPFSVMKDNSSLFLWLKPWIIWTKRAHQKEIFRLLNG